MRLIRLAAASAACLFCGAASLTAQSEKVGYINSDAILLEYGPAQDAQRSLEATLAGYEAEIGQLDADYRREVGEYQQQQMTMNPEARAAREQELGDRLQSLEARRQELNEQALQRQGEVFQPIMEEIRAVLEAIRVEGGYALILDTASRAILVADPALDLTEQVLARLNSRSEPEADG